MQSILNRLVISGGRQDGLDGSWTILASCLTYNGEEVPMRHGLKLDGFGGLYRNGLCLSKTDDGVLLNMFTVENCTVSIDTAILFDANTYEVVRGVFNCFALGFRDFDVEGAEERARDLFEEYRGRLTWSEKAAQTTTPFLC